MVTPLSTGRTWPVTMREFVTGEIGIAQGVDGGPMVRIHLSPADSPSLSRSHFRASRTRAFPAGVRGSLDDGVSRDAAGFPLRANRRQCLCRAIFQYRSAADAVGGNAATVRTKSGVSGLWRG